MLLEIFNNKYLDTLLIIVLLFIASKIITFIIERFVKVFTSKTKTKLDDALIEKTDKVVVWLLFFIGIRIFLVPVLQLDLINMINNAIIIFFITLTVTRVVGILIEQWGREFARKTKSKIDDALLVLFHRFSRIILFVIGGILILNTFNIEITPFLASLGIMGIVLGFALQNSLSNVFGGISLILDKNFKVGDTVKLSSGELGKIMDVGLRSTKMRTFDNELLVIPNGRLADATLQNYAQPDLYARSRIPFGVEYGSNTDKVRKLVIETLSKMTNVIKKDKKYQIEVLFIKMGDSALEFEARFWVKLYEDRFKTKVKATEEIYKSL